MININDFIEILRLSDMELFQYLTNSNKNAIVGDNFILYFVGNLTSFKRDCDMLYPGKKGQLLKGVDKDFPNLL